MKVIGGFREWLRAYPGLYFEVVIYEQLEVEGESEDMDRYFVGKGLIGNMQ